VTGQTKTGRTTSGGGADGSEAATPSARRPTPTRLTKNAQFRRVAKGARFHGSAFILQSLRRPDAAVEGPRVGFTVTRKTGTAVERNRMRRRLKEALRLAPDLCAAPDCDYVLVIRRDALSIPFEQLIGEVTRAFREIAGRKGRRTRAAA
jgi:ribonuclease P protein component